MRHDATQIKAFLQKRKITTLCHFTDERNLNYILKFGLLSRQKLREKHYKYIYNDEIRLDGMMDFISLSITNINHFLADRFIKQGKIQQCMVIELDANLLWKQFSRRLYCQTNAATTGCQKGDSLADFEALFDNQVNYKGRMLNRENLNINQPTDAQAEILWAGWVKPEFIKKYYKYP